MQLITESVKGDISDILKRAEICAAIIVYLPFMDIVITYIFNAEFTRAFIHQDDDIDLRHVTVFEFVAFFIFDTGILPHNEIGGIYLTAFSRKIETDLLHFDIYDALTTNLHQQIHDDQAAVFRERMTFPFDGIFDLYFFAHDCGQETFQALRVEFGREDFSEELVIGDQ